MLTEEQIKAITSDKGCILLNAGQGSGKTTVLTERIVHMVKNWKVPENRIHIIYIILAILLIRIMSMLNLWWVKEDCN